MGAWTAIDATTDRRAWARRLARARDRVLGGEPADRTVRAEILGSWRRSRGAGVDPSGGLAPLVTPSDEAAERFARHPVSTALPALRSLLDDARREDGQVLLFCDADGTLLWIDGEPAVLDAARAVHLEPGAAWSEARAGTNAMGTALALGHPMQVFSHEHYAEAVGRWTCAAAPIHDPGSGRLLGVLDLSGDLRTAHPHSLTLVTAAARLVEAELASAAPATGAAPAPRATPVLRVEVRAPDHVEVDLDDGCAPHALSPRRSELLVLLCLRPAGWTAGELALELLGEDAKPVSVRAELSRLRRLLGDRLAHRPYRLEGEVRFAPLEAEEALRRGDVHGAFDRYPTELLPYSEAGEIAELRRRLEVGLRDAVLRAGDPALLERWLRHPASRHDEEAARALARAAPPGSPARATALARLAERPCDAI